MSTKELDAKGRWRSKTVAFRMSPEEARLLDQRVSMSGLTKQAFIAAALNDPPVTVHATVRMRKNMQEQLAPLCAELRRIRRAGDMPDELVESVEAIAEFVGAFDVVDSPVDSDDVAILNLSRV